MAMPYPRVLAQDVAASVGFYTELLGCPPAKLIPDTYAHFEQDDETRLAVLARSALADVALLGELERAGGESVVSVMLVLRVDSVDATVARLAEHGAEVVAEAADRPGWNLRSAYLCDPDGNLVELQQY